VICKQTQNKNKTMIYRILSTWMATDAAVFTNLAITHADDKYKYALLIGAAVFSGIMALVVAVFDAKDA